MAGAAPELRRNASPVPGGGSPTADDSRGIECASAVLQSLRTLVLERFNQLPHGGPETFGVLFGERHGNELRIAAVRPLPAEAILAASVLSEPEREAFRNLVLSIENEPDLAGLETVGWFRAHPRSDLDLSSRDLEISTSLFPEIWQVAMVLRPGNSTAGFVRLYFRDSDGALHTDRAYREFAIPTAPYTLPISNIEDHAGTAEEHGEVHNGEALFALHRGLHSGLASACHSGAVAGTEQPGRNLLWLVEARQRISAAWSTRRWPLALIAAAALVGTLYWATRPPRPLALLVQDSAGQLVISWDKTARPIQNAQSAHLEIGDGNSKLWLELDREQLRIGNVTYKRRSADVTVRLVIQSPGERPLEEMARFLGQAGQYQGNAADTAAQNYRPLDGASRIKPEQPLDTAYARRQDGALVVPVPIDGAARRTEAAANFIPPSRHPVDWGTIPLAAPELAAPPQLQHQSLSTTLQARPELLPENLGGEHRPPAPAAPPSASSPLNSDTPTHAPAAARVAPAALTAGRLLWIGRLQKNQTLQINGKICSTGTLIGELPLRPVKFSVSPGDLSSDGIVLYTSNLQYANSVVEPPSAQNGWNRTVYTWNPRFANDIAIQESPASENGWGRMVLRSKNPKMSVIVIDWSLVN